VQHYRDRTDLSEQTPDIRPVVETGRQSPKPTALLTFATGAVTADHGRSTLAPQGLPHYPAGGAEGGAMRRWLFLGLAAAALCATQPADAQGPVPSTIRSSGLTQEQEQELRRRLGLLDSQLRTLASETELRESAVRNIAVEIFDARPGLDFETYAALIDSGARELRAYITQARTRADPDPASQALRAQAIAAAEDGRLTEARALYDQLIAANRAARQAQRHLKDLADAADMAEAARLAYAVADFRNAAARYAQAAELAPDGVRERWMYRMHQADALSEQGKRFGDAADLRAAVDAYEHLALPLAPRAMRAEDWSATQNDLGLTLFRLGELGDPDAIARALAAFNAALQVRDRHQTPLEWADTQNNFGMALALRGERGDAAALDRAIDAYRTASEEYSRQGDRPSWASAQNNLGNALVHRVDLGAGHGLTTMEARQLLREALAAFHGALEVRTREASPLAWASTMQNLATAYATIGDGGGGPESGRVPLREAISIYRDVLTVIHRDNVPFQWAQVHANLASVAARLSQRGDPSALAEGLLSSQAAAEIIDQTAAPHPWAALRYTAAQIHGGLAAHGDRSHLQLAFSAAQDALAEFERLGDATWVANTRRLIGELRALE
jgi:tetratricopeptide (TPR) repeat protein